MNNGSRHEIYLLACPRPIRSFVFESNQGNQAKSKAKQINTISHISSAGGPLFASVRDSWSFKSTAAKPPSGFGAPVQQVEFQAQTHADPQNIIGNKLAKI